MLNPFSKKMRAVHTGAQPRIRFQTELFFPLFLVAIAFPQFSNGSETSIGDVVTASGSVKARGATGKNSRNLESGGKIYLKEVINTGSDGRVKILLHDKTILDIGPSSLFEVEKYSAKNAEGKNGSGERQVQVSLPYGKLRTAVTEKLKGDGQFKVKTATATMGVRGTEFVVKSDSAQSTGPSIAPETQITVLSGEVALEQKQDPARDTASSPSSSEGANGGFAAGGLSGLGNNSSPDSSRPMTLTAGTQVSIGGEKANETRGNSPSTEPTKISESELREVASESTVKDSSFSEKVTISDSATQEKKETASNDASPSKSGDSRAPASQQGDAGAQESGSGAEAFSTLTAMVSDAPVVTEIPLFTLDIPGTFDLTDSSTASATATTSSTLGTSAKISITVQ